MRASMQVEASRLNLTAVQSYVQQVAALTMHSGELNMKGEFGYAERADSHFPITFKGDVLVADLRTTDQVINQDFVKWQQVAITGIDLSDRKLDIQSIVAKEPYARVVIESDKSLNVAKVMQPASVAKEGGGAKAPSGTSGTDKTSAASLPIKIRKVTFIDGSANFADYSIQPSFATGILGLNGEVSGMSSDPKSRAKVKLQGKVDRYAPVEVSGEVNLLAAAKYSDLSMSFRNIELTTFNPYSGKFAGYNISKGKLSTDMHYKVAERKLDATHHIVLDNLEFGEKTDSKDAAPIPLKLGVALLKDRQGIIDLNLPVAGTLDDPKFRLGPILWKAFLGLVTKIVTAPFAALGTLFGGGEDLAFVDFPAGSAVLDPTETAKLNNLSKALVDRPQLRLNVPTTVLESRDAEGMARAALVSKLNDDADVTLTDDKNKKARVAALENLYSKVEGKRVAYPEEITKDKKQMIDAQLNYLQEALMSKLRPSKDELTALGQARARAVQEALLSNADLDPARVFITTERSQPKFEQDRVRMEMKLE
jgi:hypothetical protein